MSYYYYSLFCSATLTGFTALGLFLRSINIRPYYCSYFIALGLFLLKAKFIPSIKTPLLGGLISAWSVFTFYCFEQSDLSYDPFRSSPILLLIVSI